MNSKKLYEKAVITVEPGLGYLVSCYKREACFKETHFTTLDDAQHYARAAANMVVNEVPLEVRDSAIESMDTKPSHYHSQPYDVAEIQEQVALNVLFGNTYLDKPENYVVNKEEIKKAMWTSFGIKHILRAGLKDDVDCELKKAENYLHRARTGIWLED